MSTTVCHDLLNDILEDSFDNSVFCVDVRGNIPPVDHNVLLTVRNLRCKCTCWILRCTGVCECCCLEKEKRKEDWFILQFLIKKVFKFLFLCQANYVLGLYSYLKSKINNFMKEKKLKFLIRCYYPILNKISFFALWSHFMVIKRRFFMQL